MRPYYVEDGITLYLGDSREIVPSLIAVDLILMDPPYGIGWSRGIHAARNSAPHEGIVGDSDTFLRDDLLLKFPDTPGIVFGSFYAPFPASLKQVLVWSKPGDSGVVGATTGFRRDVEPIFLVGPWPIRPVLWRSVLHSERGMSATTTETGHPHTKPIGLLSVLLERAPAGLVLDPFCGSGSTLVACKKDRRQAIGIEIEERYCEIAAKRLSQEVFDFGAPQPVNGALDKR